MAADGQAEAISFSGRAASTSRCTRLRLVACGAATVLGAGLAGLVASSGRAASAGPVVDASENDDPNWGCGVLGYIPGITPDGHASAETQRLVDALKTTSVFNKVSYWNWNLAPQTEDEKQQRKELLTADFLFMPEQWGAGAVNAEWVREAGQANFLDSDGQVCPAEMGNIFLGANEPDIIGSCMGNMFGKCKAPCDDASVSSGDCPVAYLDRTQPAAPNEKGQCNCWQYSHATGVGFWPLEGCGAPQPLPTVWQDPACVDIVMNDWKATAATAVSKGYKYLTTPLIAEEMDYAEKFIAKACGCSAPGQCSCTDASCGCPVYVAFHFYAYDCQPNLPSGYPSFKAKLDAAAGIMERYPFVKGAIVNEVGMLNCQSSDQNPICVPNSGQHPASGQPDAACPSTGDLPEGLATFVDKLFDLVIAAKTTDGRSVVKGFSWFNENMDGGTYNLRLFNDDGSVNKVGEAYMNACKRWRASTTELQF